MMILNEDKNEHGRLVELSDSDFEIADGQPDVTGWNVKTTNGEKIGEVDDVLFDPASCKVRYLIVDMEDNDLDLEVERRILLPIGVAELHERDDNVIVPNITVKQLADLPPYEKDGLTPQIESDIREIYEDKPQTDRSPANLETYDLNDFYTHSHFDDNKFYGTRNTEKADAKLPLTDDSFPFETGTIGRISTSSDDTTPIEYPEEEDLEEELRKRPYPEKGSN